MTHLTFSKPIKCIGESLFNLHLITRGPSQSIGAPVISANLLTFVQVAQIYKFAVGEATRNCKIVNRIAGDRIIYGIAAVLNHLLIPVQFLFSRRSPRGLSNPPPIRYPYLNAAATLQSKFGYRCSIVMYRCWFTMTEQTYYN